MQGEREAGGGQGAARPAARGARGCGGAVRAAGLCPQFACPARWEYLLLSRVSQTAKERAGYKIAASQHRSSHARKASQVQTLDTDCKNILY